MQNGKSATQQDRGMNRGVTKATRSVEEKRKKTTETMRYKQEVKEFKDVNARNIHDTDDKGTDVETKRKLQPPTVNKNKTKVISFSKEDDSRVSYSIQKLLSVYQSPKTDKSPNGHRPQLVENKKPRVYARPSRNNISKIPEIQGGLKNGSINTDKVLNRKISPVQRIHSDVKNLVVQQRKTEEAHTRKTLQKPKTSPGRTKTDLPEENVETKTPEKEASEKEVNPCDEIIPLLTPDRGINSPLDQIHSLLANYLEEDSEESCESKNKLEFFMPENSVNAFPVCSKRATDNIPRLDLFRPEVVPSAREFIIMLRRRNSEPYSPKSCILHYSSQEEDHPLSSPVSDAWGFGCENYYFWEQGPIHSSKPYWEVSLFKSNKSSSAINSTAGLLSLTPPKHTGEIFINGDFGPGYRGRGVNSWSPDLHSCKSLARTLPFVNSMKTLTSLPPAQAKTAAKQETRSPGISKDDHYKHPAHLLIYVKSSQKKLVSLDSNRGNDFANKKVHKIKKILGGTSETRRASCKNVMFSILAVVLLTGGFAFFVYFLARFPNLSNLTPLIPGLLRRC